MDQISSSEIQFYMGKTKNPPKYPELDQLPTETLIWLLAGLPGSADEMYFMDKRSGFQTNTESYYRDCLGLDYVDRFFSSDGKINLDYLIGLIPKEGEWLGKEVDEGDCDWNWVTVEEQIEKREMEGFFDDDCDDEKDEDFDYDDQDFDYADEDIDDDDNDDRNLILMGKQILLKLFEGGKIEVDLEKVSVQKAQWVIYNHSGKLTKFILFMVRNMFLNNNLFMKTYIPIFELTKTKETQVWKIFDNGQVSFQHKSADSPFFISYNNF